MYQRSRKQSLCAAQGELENYGRQVIYPYARDQSVAKYLRSGMDDINSAKRYLIATYRAKGVNSSRPLNDSSNDSYTSWHNRFAIRTRKDEAWIYLLLMSIDVLIVEYRIVADREKRVACANRPKFWLLKQSDSCNKKTDFRRHLRVLLGRCIFICV